MSSGMRFAILATGAITLVACSGRSQTAAGSRPAKAPAQPVIAESSAPPAPATPRWVGSDNASRTATLSLEVTRPAGAPSALINGFRAGEARITVPLGWTVKWDWQNADSTSSHSLVVMAQREKIPLEGGRPAFSNAMTRMVTAGLSGGQKDQTTFQAEESGWFWLLCGVPEHALAGEWLELRVDPDASSAGLQIRSVKQ